MDTSIIREQIIGSGFEVMNTMGIGFLKNVYRNSLAVELRLRGIAVEREKPLPVFYKGELVGEYRADLIAAQKVLIELKVADAIADAHIAQTLNYLRVANLQDGLILNFGKSNVGIKKVIRSEQQA